MRAGAFSGDSRTQRVVAFYQGLSPSNLAQLDKVYADAAQFIDPFNDVSGVPAIRRVFEHMFQTVQAPRFEVLESLTEGDRSFLLWHFVFGAPGKETTVLGGSHLHYAADGRIAFHRDHWDPARELYEQVPVLGGLMRLLRRRLRTPD
jgi:predicted SnoaL-like aldol condensation-catalyzing enzyme